MNASAAAHVHEVLAYNYAHDSPNKIHDDEVAAQYGFKGGLVPGAADYGYLCQAVYKAWGDPWLHGGSMEAKFIKPIYHGEVARAEARATGDPNVFALALVDPRGAECAVGRAALASGEQPPRIEDFPRHECPAPDALPEPTVATFETGRALGAYEFDYDEADAVERATELFVEPLIGADGRPRWHPALCAQYGNQVIIGNVRLDAWVHTASRVHYFDQPRQGERLSLRGQVASTYEKRGHVMTECALALFADGSRALARVHHTAIIRLAPARAS